jgi:hypothetical protein
VSYIVYADMKGLIPDEWLLQAADDNADGVEDAFEEARDLAEDDINAILSARYTTPIENGSSIPFLKSVTKYHTLEVLYARRGYSQDAFPHRATLKTFWDQLQAIGRREMELDPAKGASQQITTKPGFVIAGKAKTYSSNGSNTA